MAVQPDHMGRVNKRILREKLVDNPGAFVLVVAGPSGVGKTSICEAVLDAVPDVQRCVTTTTRPRRDDEVEGVSRHFVSEDQFEQMRKEGAFVEHAEVHGHLYGATFDAVLQAMDGGRTVLMDVDVQGVDTWKAVLGKRCVTVFVVPPSLEVLADRLRARDSEVEETFNLRMDNAVEELKRATLCEYVIVNDDLIHAIADLQAIICAERRRVVRMHKALLAIDVTVPDAL